MSLQLPAKLFVALFLGIVVGAVSTNYVSNTLNGEPGWHFNFGKDSHDYGLGEKDFHVHADFLLVINDQQIDLTDDKYMSTAKRILHPGVHLHDNKDGIIHFHAPGVSLVEFMDSLSLPLTDSCLTFAETKYCTEETTRLLLYVNEIDKTADLLTYEPKDEDRVLLYYGTPEETLISPWLQRVTDRACIYTGSCPERGTAPPEECGLTCEL